MILNPTPFMGWNGAYKGPINHVAMALNITVGAELVNTDLGFRISGNGRRFHARELAGDLAVATQGGPGLPGAFYPAAIKLIGGALYAVGRLWDDGNNSRCAIFRCEDGGRTWNRKQTSIDGTAGISGARFFVGIAANDGYITALSSTGERAVSTDDGETFTGYGNIGFSGSQPARCIEASGAGFVVGGLAGQLFTATDPRSSWTTRTSHFGTAAINVAVAGNVILLAGNGGQAVTAPLNDLTTFTPISNAVPQSLTGAAYSVGRWFLWGAGGVWRTSADAVSGFAEPAKKPGGAGLTLARSCYHDGEKWVVHWGEGKLSIGADGDWENIELPGLVSAPYIGCSA